MLSIKNIKRLNFFHASYLLLLILFGFFYHQSYASEHSIMINNTGVIIYNKNTTPVWSETDINNIVNFLKKNFSNTKIIYLDGFEMWSDEDGSSSIDPVPKNQKDKGYSYRDLVSKLHNSGYKVILQSAWGDNNLKLTDNTIDTLESAQNWMQADGIAIDDEINKNSQTYFEDNQKELTKLGNKEVSNKKYFGIITGLDTTQGANDREGAIAPLFRGITCDSDGTNYCFETVMIYDHPNSNYPGSYVRTSLDNQLGFMYSLSSKNFLYAREPEDNYTNEPIIRIMLPLTYSVSAYPYIDKQTGLISGETKKCSSYSDFINDLFQTVEVWKGKLNNTSPSCYDYSNFKSYPAQPSRLFNNGSNAPILGGIDFYRIGTKEYASKYKQEGKGALMADHYLCSDQQGFLCDNNNQVTAWIPKASDSIIKLIQQF